MNLSEQHKCVSVASQIQRGPPSIMPVCVCVCVLKGETTYLLLWKEISKWIQDHWSQKLH